MEGQVEHLWHVADSIPQTAKENAKVRSHLLSLCKEISANEDLEPPSKLFGDHAVCKFCLNRWKFGQFTVRILPRKVPGKRMKKIIRKSSEKESLNKHELRLFERYEKNNNNKLSILCLECHKKTVISLKKPLINVYKVKETGPEYDNSETTSKKKKKKKRDPFAGLKPSVCTPLTTKIKKSPLNTASPISAHKMSLKTLPVGHVTVNQKSSPLSTKICHNSRLKNTNKLQKILANSSKKQKVASLKAFLNSVT